MTSQVDLLEIPGVMFSEDYASLGTFFLLFVQIVPALSGRHSVAGEPRCDAPRA